MITFASGGYFFPDSIDLPPIVICSTISWFRISPEFFRSYSGKASILLKPAARKAVSTVAYDVFFNFFQRWRCHPAIVRLSYKD